MGITKQDVHLVASDRNWIEGAAVQQLEKTAELPGMVAAAGMPDLHPGRGYPIGAAFASAGVIYPALVGNDIGCGMGLWQTELTRKKVKRDQWAGKLNDMEGPWNGDRDAVLAEHGAAPTAFDESLGTIGGGNHFAELQQFDRIEDAETLDVLRMDRNRLQLLVHSGSRGYGESILRAHVERFGANGLQAGTDEAAAYLVAHDRAVRWGVANRALIAQRFLSDLGTAGERLIDVCHNNVTEAVVAGCACWLHRKGAAPATAGPVLIPGSRGSLTYLVLPQGDQEKNLFSLAHGAGRKWNRGDTRDRVRARFRPEQLETTVLGSRVICEDRDLLLEEAPIAYKNVDVVVGDLVEAGLVRIVATLKPILTYKRRETRR